MPKLSRFEKQSQLKAIEAMYTRNVQRQQEDPVTYQQAITNDSYTDALRTVREEIHNMNLPMWNPAGSNYTVTGTTATVPLERFYYNGQQLDNGMTLSWNTYTELAPLEIEEPEPPKPEVSFRLPEPAKRQLCL